MSDTRPDHSRDTQWPRFEVFQQSREGAPFHNVGSVHAPDEEMALQNARDVFVRRPKTVRLWVVPARQIFTRTGEEVEDDPAWREEMVAEDVPPKQYHVFRKTSQRRSMNFVVHAGEVEAATPVQALEKAIERYGDETVYVWWIVPAAAVVASDEEEAESMFSPAHNKDFRMPTAYRTRTMMREVMQRGEAQQEQGQREKEQNEGVRNE
ncbi:MAG: hypothetical protein R3248_03535 [Candidatus Promineifilaceae bacterium]|nr:hypothetical protein [Candidatus Promineifilaceae bacterium]